MDATHSQHAAESAPVEVIDVAAVNRRGERKLYARRPRIHPRRARGAFRQLKWIVMAITLAVYYLTPWIRWDRGAFAPDQAVLIDLPARRFYFFFIEIWPQEVYYFTGLLILAAISLFLFTALLGRVWCGYSCPQTVWTDLFIAVERMVEGDRNARIRLDRTPWGAGKIAKKAVKHAIWLVIAMLTGGAWVFYYADAPTLAVQLATVSAPAPAWIAIGVLTFTTYMLGAIAREQVCTYMCPWPRIQAAMMDPESLTVTYRADRGEPRGSHKQGESWEGRGHCVDCNQCVSVCPMGIDIRDGAQLECITCALCIDACNGVMDRVGLPRGLISYDALANADRRAAGLAPRIRPVRPRTVLYAALIAVVGAVMLYALLTRSPLDINVLHDRNPLFVMLSDGSIRNGYTLKIINKLHSVRTFRLGVDGPAGTTLALVGDTGGGGPPLIVVRPDRLRSVHVFATVPRAALRGRGSVPLRFVLTDVDSGTAVTYDASVRGPRR